MDLIDKNKDNIKEGDYEKMCNVIKYLHMKNMSRQYNIIKFHMKIYLIKILQILINY
jgi:hypothetical protein